MAIPARRATTCTHCGGTIARGELICSVNGVWIHDACREAADLKADEPAISSPPTKPDWIER